MAEDEKREPTLAEVVEMSQAMEKRLAELEASTAAEAKPEVEEQLKEEAHKQGIELSDEDAGKIATMMIAEFEKRGAFGEPPSGDAAPVPPEETAQPDPGTGGVGEGGEAAPEGPGAEVAPQRKSLAERFAGR